MLLKAEITYKSKEFYYYTEDLKASLSLPLQMIRIPSGSFPMGAPDGEEGSREAEKPPREVKVSGFYMSRYPITQEQWRAVAGRKDLKAAADYHLELDPSSFKEDSEEKDDRWKRPVELISWQDAMVYCARLSELTGRAYSLPSEARWEYACRAGTVTPFHFGESMTTDLANYNGTRGYGKGPEGTYRRGTTPVDFFKAPNNFGLSDMHGNVWEWCLDPWHDNYRGAPEDGRVWDEGNASLYEDISRNIDGLLRLNSFRVFRGGSWINDPGRCRSARRDSSDRANRTYDIGFRVTSAAGRTL